MPAHLRPLADGLVSMRRPQSGVVWLRRSAITRETLRGLAHGRIPCSHAAVDALGADRAVEYLRCLLVRYGVLPPRDRRLADFQRWAAAKLDGIGNPSTASYSNGFSAGTCYGTCDPAAPP